MQSRALNLASLAALPAIFAALVLAASPAFASSDDAWAALRQDVAKACKASAGQDFVKPAVIVDPFGSENFGLAIVTGKLKAGGKGSVICLYDKKTKRVEHGSELGEDVLKIRK